VIERLRNEIEDRLDQLLAEADKLRKALAALHPRAGKSTTAPERPRRSSPASTPRRTRPPSRATPRTASGATKARALAALADGEAMTAGEVAAATGLARATVSTTLSRLATGGEVLKAERGYRLRQSDDPHEGNNASR
jgi:DNA-binding transcriptional ArsR family regulator